MPPPLERAIYFIAGAASISLLTLLYNIRVSKPHTPRIHLSPLHTTIPTLSPSALTTLAYSPDHPLLPNPHDIPTPYGAIRTYTFGSPATTPHRRILFLHGISTPCISLAPIASALAHRGCRVLLLDLFGRGFSDAPDPRDVRYDGGLYAAQVLMALAGGEGTAAWLSEGFSVVGYSLGGGLAADFAAWFPGVVRDLVLLAPAGLVREGRVGWVSRVLYSVGWVPEGLLVWIVKRRMRAQLSGGGAGRRAGDEEKTEVTDAVVAEIGSVKEAMKRPAVDAEGAVAWQLEHHPGFIPAFMSSLRYSPIHGQHARWSIIGQRLDAAGVSASGSLQSGAVLILLGAKDPIVVCEEIKEDATLALGKQNVAFRVLEDAGHEFPMTHADETVELIWDFWQENNDVLS